MHDSWACGRADCRHSSQPALNDVCMKSLFRCLLRNKVVHMAKQCFAKHSPKLALRCSSTRWHGRCKFSFKARRAQIKYKSRKTQKNISLQRESSGRIYSELKLLSQASMKRGCTELCGVTCAIIKSSYLTPSFLVQVQRPDKLGCLLAPANIGHVGNFGRQ